MLILLRILFVGSIAAIIKSIIDENNEDVIVATLFAIVALLCIIEDHLDNLRDAFECDADTKGADRG